MAELSPHHVGITFPVDDLDEAIDYYRDALDLTVAARLTVSGETLSRAVDVPDATARVAHLDAGEIFVELIEYEPEGPTRDRGAINEPGFKHMAFETDDIDAVLEDLPEGTDTLSAPTTLSSGTRVLFFRDPWGNLIELAEGISVGE